MSFLRQEINITKLSIIIIFIIIDLKTQNKKKLFYIMQIAYTNEFGKVRNLNDNVREFPQVRY